MGLCSKLGTTLGLSQICSKFFPKCFQEFPKIFTYSICYRLALSWNILISECSIRVFHYKVTVLLESIDVFVYCSLQFPLTALLGSIDLFSMELSFEVEISSFHCAGIFDTGLYSMIFKGSGGMPYRKIVNSEINFTLTAPPGCYAHYHSPQCYLDKNP